MRLSTIINIKRQLRLFEDVVRATAVLFDKPGYIMISVILDRIGFYSPEALNSATPEEMVIELHQANKLLQDIARYHDSHFESWVSEEVNYIILAGEYEEFEEDYANYAEREL